MTSKIRLRDVVAEDLDIFFEQYQDPQALQMAGFPARERDEFTAHWMRVLANPAIIKMTVEYDGQIAGNVVCFEESGKSFVGYWIGKAYWNQGIATQALADLLEQAKSRPLYAYVARQNVASIHVLEKCGFRKCGEETDEYMFELG